VYCIVNEERYIRQNTKENVQDINKVSCSFGCSRFRVKGKRGCYVFDVGVVRTWTVRSDRRLMEVLRGGRGANA
jgi:hypothetical protein